MASGMRTLPKIQIAAVILCGFLAGYIWFSRGNHKPAIEFSELGHSFIVEGREMRILSGTIHYFRVVPDYWEDRLRKLKAAGLNTVETYVAWNMHEPIPNQYDFTGIRDLGKFIRTAQRVGLYVIVRPGPFICAEWELGGLPPWLLHDPKMKLRTTYPPHLHAVERYFNRLFEILVPLQSAFGGPIIAFQIENEFAHYSYSPTTMPSGKKYLRFLHHLMRDLGVVELLFTSDGQVALENSRALRPAKDVLLTVNFQNEKEGLKKLLELQPHKPLMVMEFWTGWFDNWNEPHLKRNILPNELATRVESILQRGASMNFYMFHGGTNFGFMNGAKWGNYKDTSVYQPITTSYDYGAPISECGDITEKYKVIRRVISKNFPSVDPLPPLPPNPPKEAYGDVRLTQYVRLPSTLQYIPDPHVSELPIAMEYLPINQNWGQGYGFALYRTHIPADAVKITVQGLKDYGVAMIDNKPVKTFAYSEREMFLLPKSERKKTALDQDGHAQVVLDILVENAGRVNVGAPFESRKGILGGVQVDGREQKHWKIFSFEFKSAYVENIDSGDMWQQTPATSDVGPTLFKGTLNINGQPKDTFIDMEGWGKGVVFINGVNLGRYWSVGPQRTLYVPAPILQTGVNKVMIFETRKPRSPQILTFKDTHNLTSIPSSKEDFHLQF